MAEDTYDARAELLGSLMQKLEEDRFPSTTMLDTIEELLTPDDLPAYVQALTKRVKSEQYPSIPMIDRLRNLI